MKELSPEKTKELRFALDIAASRTVQDAGGSPTDLLDIQTFILASTIISVAVADQLRHLDQHFYEQISGLHPVVLTHMPGEALHFRQHPVRHVDTADLVTALLGAEATASLLTGAFLPCL